MYSKIPQNELQQNNNLFHGYADAAYANTDDYKSTSGYVFVVGGGAIMWRSKKQTTIALSSMEAEYIALSEAGREARWLHNLYEEIGYIQTSPNIIKGDNKGSISMAHNPQFHIGIVTGNPGVFQGNPHPYPWKPAPAATGMGFRGYGCGFY